MSKVRTSIFLVVLGVLGYMSIRHHYEVQGLLLLVAQQQQQLLEQTITKGTDTLDNSSAAAAASPSPVKDASTQSLWAALLRLPPLGLGIGQIPPVIPGFLSSDKGDIISSIASPLLALLEAPPNSHITTKTWSPSEMLSSPWGIVVILLLGFLLGILFSETPFVDPILRLLGLADSRRFGVDILQGTAWTFVDHPTQGSKGSAAAGACDGGSGICDEARQTENGHLTTETMASISPSPSTLLLNDDRKTGQPLKPLGFQKTNYGLRYSFLNVEVTGGWLGMGLWPKDGTKIPYREACQAMVRKVTAGLNIDATSHLLDVGFGCGDQTVYMAELYGPKRITGITIEPLQHYAGEQLVLNSRSRTPNTSIELYVADASNLLDFLKEHPQVLGSRLENGQSPLPSSSLWTQRCFTHIISIDSAYHYNTRRKFFEQAYAVLEPGRGLLAMADVIPRRHPPMTGIKGWMFRQFSRWYLKVPLENMQTLEEYRQMLEEVGFQEIEIETVEDQVFLGWADFISTQLRVLKSVGLVRPRVGWSFWLLQNVLRSVDRSKTMHFIIVKARRGD
ncbi:hypothetical protein BGW41_005209 [Actinomortierella wolfii]|nr:hypothetical protein BGW41_005209 [Actinomortierella wolfii]